MFAILLKDLLRNDMIPQVLKAVLNLCKQSQLFPYLHFDIGKYLYQGNNKDKFKSLLAGSKVIIILDAQLHEIELQEYGSGAHA
jgi:hypothetical protein